MHVPQLSYLGVISQPERSEYHFRIINEDLTARLLVLTIAHSVFLTKQLMIQEAPDLCFQKVLADLRSESPALLQDIVSINESDIAHYRDSHPDMSLQPRSHRKFIK